MVVSDFPAAAGGLCTDLYEIRMAASYLRRGMTAPATFSLFVRRLPPTRDFLVAAGLESCLGLLTGFGFDSTDVAYLRDECGFTTADTEALVRVHFTGNVQAVPEGRIVFADEPLLEVTAPLPEAQLVETQLLNQITLATTIASKAARCRLAAPDATLAGFDTTSCVKAARELGLTAVGTVARSYIHAFPTELEAFRAFAEDFPTHAVFLVDTYDTTAGISHAVQVTRSTGLPPEQIGLCLDSGDLATQAQTARRMLLEWLGLSERGSAAQGQGTLSGDAADPTVQLGAHFA